MLKTQNSAAAPDLYSKLSEHAIQAALFRAYEQRGIGGSVLMFAIPNGATLGDESDVQTRQIRGRYLKNEGLQPGAPDICIVQEGAVWFLEIKRDKGVLSPAQKAFHGKLEAAGVVVLTAYGFLDAVRLLEDCGVLRKSAKIA